MTHCVVVDTNVFCVAAELHEQASDECILACIQLLRRIDGGQRLAVDSDDEILVEYIGALRCCNRGQISSVAREVHAPRTVLLKRAEARLAAGFIGEAG